MAESGIHTIRSNPRARILGEPQRRVVRAPDDLLTAGLGLEGLRGDVPGFSDPLAPTPAELRRRAIYQHYRGLHQVGDAFGFGRLFGPRPGQRHSGIEYLVAMAGPDGTGRHTAWLQIPDSFDPQRPRLVAAAASGSRGVHGALPIAGAWAFANGYALVSTDKGTGTGLFDIDSGTAIRIDGTLTQDLADPLAMFAPSLAAGTPEAHTVLFRHAQGGNNPEREWGDYLLQAIDIALRLLAQEFPQDRAGHRFAPEDVRILATGISNGGMTALRALERDVEHWIDGAVVSEPNVLVDGQTTGLEVVSEGRVLEAPGRSLFAYGMEHFLLQPCTLLDGMPADAPLLPQVAPVLPALAGWGQWLGGLGLLPLVDTRAQAASARSQLQATGIRSEAFALGAFNLVGNLWPAVAYSYAMAYGRVLPHERPCGVRFAATDATGRPRALRREELALAFTDGGGIAPTLGINAVAPLAPGTPPLVANQGSVPLALAFRGLVDDRLPGDALLRQRVRAGLAEATMSGRPGERPVLMLHGRADSLIPVNHASRAYYALALVNGAANLRYYEVVHAQHFDGYLGMPGFDSRYVPLNPQVERGLDCLRTHLESGAPLPPSQVVRSTPRGSALPPITELHLGAIASALDPGNRIRFDGRRLTVPE